MFISVAGNVGIGTTTINASSGYKMLRINGATTGGEIVLAGAEVEHAYMYASSGIFVIDAFDSKPMRFRTGNQNRIDITSGGNVLIGTTTDGGRKLEIQTSSTNAALWVQTGGTTDSYVIADFRTGTNLPALQILGNGVSNFGGKVFGSGFTSRSGSTSIASGATATIATMDVNGIFLVNIQVNGGSLIFNAANYFIANNTNGQYVNAGALYDGANVTLSNSGSAIQITNDGFSTLTWQWSVFIMPYALI
jgi:hypothetical protein